MSKRAAISSSALLLTLLLCLASAELVLRFRGYEPFNPEKWSFVQVEPGGKKFQKHPSLGYSNLPGRFEVTLHGRLAHTMTHGEDGLRITRPRDLEPQFAEKPEVWVMGCSFTHGNSLSDHETYPWLLQQRFPLFDFVNFGVDGYGTVQALIQLTEGLETRPRPELVILAYTSLHDERNTFSNGLRRRRHMYSSLGPLVQPYARLDEAGELWLEKADDVEYRPWPLATSSALVHLAQEAHGALQDRGLDSHAVTKALVERIHEVCLEHGVELLVVNLWEPDDMASFCEDRGLLFVDAHVDLSWSENNHLPLDGHPSAFANWQYAQVISEFLHGRGLLPGTGVEGSDPTSAGWYLQLGMAYYDQGYYRRAAEAFERATAFDPNLALAYSNACSAHGKLEDWEEAIAWCERAVELDPELEIARNNLHWVERRGR